ncbi:MAG TPA: CGNR zinc finger domain-containing protein [Steroidobacteraceae bacterium]|nr:CGNR zinc finger domain-containing protein [Steroidobacteraceae bacterium]
MNLTARPLFLGGHPAVDFLNTAFAPNGRQIEAIPDGRALLDWMVAAGLLNEADARRVRRAGNAALDAAAQEVRKVREWARRWLERWRSAPDDGYDEEIAALNKLLARAAWHDEVISAEDGSKRLASVHDNDPGALVPLIARQIAALVTQENASLLKSCSGSGCTLWFLDRTKAHRRTFCSATACGNRAKVAAFRQRQRGGGGGGGGGGAGHQLS